MSYDLAPLKSYVRFYLAIRSQLERVWQSVVAIETAMRDELGPFAIDLAPVPLTALATLVDPPRVLPPELDALWKPEDEAELDALSDIYEVVGRFSFQGEGDRNLKQVEILVSQGRAAVAENDTALKALSVLEARALETADRLRTEETERAKSDRTARIAKLEPLIETVLTRAKQTQDALHAVPLPELDDADAAAEEYRKLRAKLQQVYQTCLPFLKNAISQVWVFIGAPVPQSFPDELPLVTDLPPGLISISAAGSEDLDTAERTLKSLAAEVELLRKAKDDIAARLTKLETDSAGFRAKHEEHSGDIEFSQTLLDWAQTAELAVALRTKARELEVELRQRVGATAEVSSVAARLGAELDAESALITERTGHLEATQHEFDELKKKEPLLFGKDEWRTKLADADARLEMARTGLAQVSQSHAQRTVELSAAQVHVQTAQAEQSIVERGLADLRGRLVESEKLERALGEKLGARKPTKPVAAAEAEEIVVAIDQRLASVDRELERIRTEQKRLKDDALRAIARERQIDVERQSAQARVEGARVALADGLDAATKRLAQERKSAVEEHVREVLGALAKSLVQVDTVFVEPARSRLLEMTEPDYSKAESVAKAGTSVAPVVSRLLAERGPELAGVEQLLARIQTEFCEAAAAACRSAWG